LVYVKATSLYLHMLKRLGAKVGEATIRLNCETWNLQVIV